MRTPLLLSAAVMLLGACSEYGIATNTTLGPNARPDIEINPERVSFGSVSVTDAGLYPTRSVEIRNVGEGILTVTSIRVTEGPFLIVDPPERLEIPPGESRPVEVEFLLDQPGLADGSMLVESDDPDESAIPVPIQARARGPWLYVDPPLHDFGSLSIGCDQQVDVVVQNVGDEGLTVESWAWDADTALQLAFDREPPFALEPGDFVLGTVDLIGTEPGVVDGELVVQSTDPRGPQTSSLSGELVKQRTRTDTFPLPPDPPVDLIIAVDQSASMEDDAELLGASFVEFATSIGEVTSNWRMGVVTYDNGCFNGGTITASTDNYLGVFRWAVQQGEDAEIQDDEALFSLVDRAIANTADGRCNAGFRRPEAALHVIVVSDEPERSTERSTSLTWDTFIDRWRGEVTTDSLLKVSGVVDLEGCGDGANGYLQGIEATGGEALSLCSADWTETATTLAEATLDRLLSFELAKEPVPDTFIVRVDGVVLPDVSYRYDARTNRLVVQAPLRGSEEISIHYTVAEDCE